MQNRIVWNDKGQKYEVRTHHACGALCFRGCKTHASIARALNIVQLLVAFAIVTCVASAFGYSHANHRAERLERKLHAVKWMIPRIVDSGDCWADSIEVDF